ncbi:MAG: methyltransferase domain-containing protein [Candidatus Diapherotrites archaeon]|nr:methyltransferase domain-containing protein [Candidatus Diapherotrites archaeon]
MANLVKHEQIGITGAVKFKKIRKYFKENESAALTILDVGGTTISANAIKEIFPNAKITIANINKKDLGHGKEFERTLVDCNSLGKINKKFDIIFANDLIEHLEDPDKFVEEAGKVCKNTLVITTPNLAAWYNRIFLLLGFDLANYSSSRVRAGNLLLAEIGAPGHKSVFTNRSLKRLLERHGFVVRKMDSFSYQMDGQLDGRGGMLRRTINFLLPKGMQEGIICYAKKIKALK